MKILDTLIDYWYALRAQVRSFGNTPTPHEWLSKDNALGDVILIAGLYERWHFLKPLGEKLHDAGYRVHVIEAIRLNRERIDIETEKLNSYLEDKQLVDVVIVSHSKGGMVGLNYLLDKEEGSRVKKLIAIAAPFSGSTIGRIIRFKAVRELLPHQEAIKRISSHKSIRNLNIISLYPNYDNHVWHAKGSLLEGATNVGHKVRGHHRVLFDDEVHSRVIAEVQK